MVTSIKEAAHPVIVTVDNHCNLLSTINLAVSIAVDRQSSLHGLFIEDVDLLQVAQLPFSQEVSLSSGKPRVFDSRQLRQNMDNCANRFQQLLASQAEQFSVSWSCSRLEGRKQVDELAQSANADYLIIGESNFQKPSPTLQRIVLLNNRSNRLMPALQTILAQNPKGIFELFLVASDQQSEKLEAIFPNLNEVLSGFPAIKLTIIQPQQLLSVLLSRTRPVNYLIGSRDSKQLATIIALARCPVIVVK